MISFQNALRYVLTLTLSPLIRLGLENECMLTVADSNNKNKNIRKEVSTKIDMVDMAHKIQNNPQ